LPTAQEGPGRPSARGSYPRRSDRTPGGRPSREAGVHKRSRRNAGSNLPSVRTDRLDSAGSFIITRSSLPAITTTTTARGATTEKSTTTRTALLPSSARPRHHHLPRDHERPVTKLIRDADTTNRLGRGFESVSIPTGLRAQGRRSYKTTTSMTPRAKDAATADTGPSSPTTPSLRTSGSSSPYNYGRASTKYGPVRYAVTNHAGRRRWEDRALTNNEYDRAHPATSTRRMPTPSPWTWGRSPADVTMTSRAPSSRRRRVLRDPGLRPDGWTLRSHQVRL
jgi:hypothetical protein